MIINDNKQYCTNIFNLVRGVASNICMGSIINIKYIIRLIFGYTNMAKASYTQIKRLKVFSTLAESTRLDCISGASDPGVLLRNQIETTAELWAHWLSLFPHRGNCLHIIIWARFYHHALEIENEHQNPSDVAQNIVNLLVEHNINTECVDGHGRTPHLLQRDLCAIDPSFKMLHIPSVESKRSLHDLGLSFAPISAPNISMPHDNMFQFPQQHANNSQWPNEMVQNMHDVMKSKMWAHPDGYFRGPRCVFEGFRPLHLCIMLLDLGLVQKALNQCPDVNALIRTPRAQNHTIHHQNELKQHIHIFKQLLQNAENAETKARCATKAYNAYVHSKHLADHFWNKTQHQLDIALPDVNKILETNALTQEPLSSLSDIVKYSTAALELCSPT